MTNQPIIPQWIQYSSDKLSLGFKTAQDCEEFIKRQSPSTDWQKQWTIKRIWAYDDPQWIIEINEPVTLHLPNQEDIFKAME